MRDVALGQVIEENHSESESAAEETGKNDQLVQNGAVSSSPVSTSGGSQQSLIDNIGGKSSSKLLETEAAARNGDNVHSPDSEV